MREFFNSNGGAVGLIVLGLLAGGFTTPYAAAVLVPLGLVLWLWRGLRLEIRRKPRTTPPSTAKSKETGASYKELNRTRQERYKQNNGLFLIHTWQPSAKEGQVADVVLRLWQHGPGPLASKEIDAVEYILGPKFTDHSRVCTDPRDGFAIEESMFKPMLCLAKVYFKDESPPILLERYTNFDYESATEQD
jgi:hypothetical protein